ncbi:hypothetical protein GCM10020001_098300 [Nonomuraea salmonea]
MAVLAVVLVAVVVELAVAAVAVAAVAVAAVASVAARALTGAGRRAMRRDKAMTVAVRRLGNGRNGRTARSSLAHVR